MKNIILIIINIIAITTCLIGATLADSTGLMLKVALVMIIAPLAWGVMFLFANRGRLQ